MNLYFVRSTTIVGEDQDLVVFAPSHLRVIDHWRQYYDTEECPEEIIKLAEFVEDPQIVEGPLDWSRGLVVYRRAELQ